MTLNILNCDQVVTTLKNTAKPVTDVQFPAVTICGSGFHMGNVEKKINRNFRKWRNDTGRNRNETDQIRADMVEYMSITFQIKAKQGGDQEPANLMDILDTMVASNVEASMAANAVRENIIACNRSAREEMTARKKRDTNPHCQMLNIDNQQQVQLLETSMLLGLPQWDSATRLEKTQNLVEQNKWTGNYALVNTEQDELVYRRKDNNRALHVKRSSLSTGQKVDYESWCYVTSGSNECKDNDEGGSASMTKVGFFEGSKTIESSDQDFNKNLGAITPPSMFWYNEQFPTTNTLPTSQTLLSVTCLDSTETSTNQNPPDCQPVGFELTIDFNYNEDITDNFRDPNSPDSSLSVMDQQKEWVGVYYGHSVVQEEGKNVVLYKKEDKERYIAFTGDDQQERTNFKSRCRKGDQWGCRDNEDRSVDPVPFFNGHFDDDYCSNTKPTITYQYNRWFGRAGNAPPNQDFGDCTNNGQCDIDREQGGYYSSGASPKPILELIPLATMSTFQRIDSVVSDALKRKCIATSANQNQTQSSTPSAQLPGIDIFLNPNKTDEKNEIVREKQKIARDYFDLTDMIALYPKLFNILWDSTLPCFGDGDEERESMLLSCEEEGKKVNCSKLFTRVPTDTGMCCALNNVDALRDSDYKQLVRGMQGRNSNTSQVKSQVGRRKGLRLTLDLHSNTVSFGTEQKEFDAFSVFIGQPREFPMMVEKSLQLQPGCEHFIELSASVVSASGIQQNILPEDRNCYFPNEGNLEFYEGYTFSNCRLECAIKKSEQIYNCTPWHLPRVGI